MGWRVRRGIKLGPIQLTLTTRGLAASLGGPLNRMSINTKGEIRHTTRIPGLGVYNTDKIGDIETPFERAAHEREAAAVSEANEIEQMRHRRSRSSADSDTAN